MSVKWFWLQFSFVKDWVSTYLPDFVGKEEEDATGIVSVTTMKLRLERVTISGWNVAEIRAKKMAAHMSWGRYLVIYHANYVI